MDAAADTTLSAMAASGRFAEAPQTAGADENGQAAAVQAEALEPLHIQAAGHDPAVASALQLKAAAGPAGHAADSVGHPVAARAHGPDANANPGAGRSAEAALADVFGTDLRSNRPLLAAALSGRDAAGQPPAVTTRPETGAAALSAAVLSDQAAADPRGRQGEMMPQPGQRPSAAVAAAAAADTQRHAAAPAEPPPAVQPPAQNRAETAAQANAAVQSQAQLDNTPADKLQADKIHAERVQADRLRATGAQPHRAENVQTGLSQPRAALQQPAAPAPPVSPADRLSHATAIPQPAQQEATQLLRTGAAAHAEVQGLAAGAAEVVRAGGRVSPVSRAVELFRQQQGNNRPAAAARGIEAATAAPVPDNPETSVFNRESGAELWRSAAAPSQHNLPGTAASAAAERPALAAQLQAQLSDAVSQQWAQQLNRQSARQMLANNRLILQLQPQQLGSLELSFSQEQGELQLSIVAREGLTRELLDATLPRLRQSLQDAGVPLTDINLRQDQSQAGLNDKRPHQQDTGPQMPGVVESEDTRTPVRPQPASNHLLDAYV